MQNFCKTCGVLLCDKRGKLRPKYCRAHFSRSPEFTQRVEGTWFKKGQEPFNKGKIYLENEKNPQWKGNAVGYIGLHAWVRRKLGTPKSCEVCGTTESSRYDWANKSGQYKRDLSDWVRMCKRCHNNFDGVNIWQQKKRAV